ncbi:lipocalin family protein [Psychrobacter sp. KFRI-CH2-11]|uniref:lipocalin family protein n=1 Tax=Psychrobacter sp. KFRI-CH2-11 TaxID=3156079 RepID=UPI00324357C3
MKTNKLPKSAWSDSQEAGSQSQQSSSFSDCYLHSELTKNSAQQTDSVSHAASNDASYRDGLVDEIASSRYSQPAPTQVSLQDSYFGYKKMSKKPAKIEESAMMDDIQATSLPKHTHTTSRYSVGYGQTPADNTAQQGTLNAYDKSNKVGASSKPSSSTADGQTSYGSTSYTDSYSEIPERVFMNGLIKHTGIALAIIIPLAAFSAYAASPEPNTAAKASSAEMTETLAVQPSDIIHKSATTPTTVDSVDLNKYAGTWYEIGRLPMYFQRNCAGDVTANYTQKTDGSGVIVTNKCLDSDGAEIVAEGLAKPADATGSKLKVTFLPSWIRWLPVGRADYWVLARDGDYKTALVGTPDKDYLWLLARSPDIAQETYAKYRQIAQQQGYDLKEFELTPQSKQTVNLVP